MECEKFLEKKVEVRGGGIGKGKKKTSSAERGKLQVQGGHTPERVNPRFQIP